LATIPDPVSSTRALATPLPRLSTTRPEILDHGISLASSFTGLSAATRNNR